MDDAGPNWGRIAITGRRSASDEFGRSCSDPNLVPGRSFLGAERLMRLSAIALKTPKVVLTRTDSMSVSGWLRRFGLLKKSLT